jgi:hypothetical protein
MEVLDQVSSDSVEVFVLDRKDENYRHILESKGIDLILAFGEKSVVAAMRTSFEFDVPCFYIADRPPSKKENAWYIEHEIGFDSLIFTSEMIQSIWNSSSSALINLENKEEIYKCLSSQLRSVKVARLQNM